MRQAIVCGALLAVVCAPAAAVPVLNPGNGHYYELIMVTDPFGGIPPGDNNSWFRARDAAAAMGGYLATVTSAQENAFLFGLVAPPPGSTDPFSGAWLGGNSTNWLVGPETGNALTYTNWGGSEPNNAGFAYMNIGGPFGSIPSGAWADDSGAQGFPEPGRDPVEGYFVEFDANPNATPAPATLLLVGLGLLGLRATRRLTPAAGRFAA